VLQTANFNLGFRRHRFSPSQPKAADYSMGRTDDNGNIDSQTAG
jgi:hypothetical protein